MVMLLLLKSSQTSVSSLCDVTFRVSDGLSICVSPQDTVLTGWLSGGLHSSSCRQSMLQEAALELETLAACTHVP